MDENSKAKHLIELTATMIQTFFNIISIICSIFLLYFTWNHNVKFAVLAFVAEALFSTIALIYKRTSDKISTYD